MTRTAVTWQAIRETVRQHVRTGTWRPGDPIPNEADLARDLGCARATVNRALRALADEGLLTRKRKAGTRVAEHPVRRAVLRIPLLRDEVQALGEAYGYRLLSDKTDTARTARRVTALHLGGGAPFALEDRRINLAAVPAAATADFSAESANAWLVRHVPFSEGRLGIGAAAATADVARHMGCAEGAALLRLSRETRDGTDWITRASLTYRPGHSLESVV